MKEPVGSDDYVLGTHDEEIARLGLQHRVWRVTTLESWRRAGLLPGQHLLDVGCGPGYATVDLAELAGPEGRVVAVERSDRFLEAARRRCHGLGLTNVDFRQADLMEDDLGAGEFDLAWCRWVACFVPDPAALVGKICRALRPGGVVVFHEYSDYATWRMAPRRSAHEEFVGEVMASWRASGGEPNIALALPSMLQAAGLVVEDVRPHLLTVSPRDYAWHWPKSFIDINLRRLLELGRVKETWVEHVRAEFHKAENDPGTLITTPLFLELRARRPV